jgi:uncharacterized protein YggE
MSSVLHIIEIDGGNMFRQLGSALIAGCMAGSAAVAQAASMSSSSASAPEITATGRGEVKLAPTYAALMVNIETRANTAVAAASQNAQKVQTVMKALQSAGLSEKDIATAGYNLQQMYDYSSNRQAPEPIGFSANTMIRAEVRRLESLGRVIDAAIGAGTTGISGVQYFASNAEEARRSAMSQAVREARTDADVLARAAGGSLGRLIALNSGGVSQPFSRDFNVLASASARVAGAPTNIVPGELNITALVSGRWEFIPGPTR